MSRTRRFPTRKDTVMTTIDSEYDRWLRRFHPSPDSRVRLVCFPHAGGSASYYFPFSKALTPDTEVLAVQYPGRQDRRDEARIEDLHELARAVFQPLLSYIDRPLALFGHSMGAAVAFEAARLLEHEAGVVPAHLFVSGRRGPLAPGPEVYLHTQGNDALLAELKELSGTGGQVMADDEMLRAVLPVLRSDYKAGETYLYRDGPDLSCPITAYVGDADPKASVDDVRLWGKHTAAGFSLTRFAGGHFYLSRKREELLHAVSAQLHALSHNAQGS
jgi:surfactin synthase thioesterase subunit